MWLGVDGSGWVFAFGMSMYVIVCVCVSVRQKFSAEKEKQLSSRVYQIFPQTKRTACRKYVNEAKIKTNEKRLPLSKLSYANRQRTFKDMPTRKT